MINTFRIAHFAWELKKPEVMEAFKNDPEGAMDRYWLAEEDRAPIRAKDLQPILDVGVNSGILRPLCQAIGIPPIVLAPRAPKLAIFDADPKDLTSEEAQHRARVEEIQADLRLAGRR